MSIKVVFLHVAATIVIGALRYMGLNLGSIGPWVINIIYASAGFVVARKSGFLLGAASGAVVASIGFNLELVIASPSHGGGFLSNYPFLPSLFWCAMAGAFYGAIGACVGVLDRRHRRNQTTH